MTILSFFCFTDSSKIIFNCLNEMVLKWLVTLPFQVKLVLFFSLFTSFPKNKTDGFFVINRKLFVNKISLWNFFHVGFDCFYQLLFWKIINNVFHKKSVNLLKILLLKKWFFFVFDRFCPSYVLVVFNIHYSCTVCKSKQKTI